MPHLIRGLHRIQDLKEQHTIDPDHGIVLGDNFLRRDIKNLLHHIHSSADFINNGNNDVQARAQGAGVPAEPLDGKFVALGHRLHRQNDDDDCKQNKYEKEDYTSI